MQLTKAYAEVIEFIAASSPQNVIAFRPSEEAKARVADLIVREKTEGLPISLTLVLFATAPKEATGSCAALSDLVYRASPPSSMPRP